MSETSTFTVSNTRTLEEPYPLQWQVSRFLQSKRDADRDARLMRRFGAKRIKVTGNRGGPWRVRALMRVGDFAHFCAVEAAREARR